MEADIKTPKNPWCFQQNPKKSSVGGGWGGGGGGGYGYLWIFSGTIHCQNLCLLRTSIETSIMNNELVTSLILYWLLQAGVMEEYDDVRRNMAENVSCDFQNLVYSLYTVKF